MFKKWIPNGAIRFCLGLILIIAFLVALFAGGMGVYASIAGITYSQAWTALIEAIRAAINK